MTKKLIITSLFFVVLIFCGTGFATDKKREVITDLTPWIGHSVSILKMYQGKSADKYFAEVKKYAPEGYTVEMIKDFTYKKYSLKFKSLDVLDENTIMIDSKIRGNYVYVGNVNTTWKDQKTTWEIFKTDSKEMIEAGFKYFLFFPFHQHGKDSLRQSTCKD